ncbi:MAG TPA: S41 family peptidase [Saprospiraceae bacterium]
MLRESIVALCVCLISTNSLCQSVKDVKTFNFGFEERTPNGKLPNGWFQWGTGGYLLTIDTVETKSGKASVQIEAVGQKEANTFGCVAYSIPAQYSGKEMEVRAFMKYKNVDEGVVGLLLRIDGVSGSLAFDNMQSKNIQGTADWTVYSVKLPYPDEAKTIYIGALLSGTGQLWVDDFQLFLDGKEIQKAKLIKPETFKADEDTAFDNGSGISTIELTSSTIKDLVILGKVWGFVKYYHPVVAGGNYNLDNELFRVLPEILEAKDQEDRNAILEKWISRLGKVKSGEDKKEDQAEIKLIPDLAWINYPDLGEHLTEKLAGIKNAKRTNEHYYIGLAPGVGNPEFKHESSYAEMKYPDVGYRLLSLYRYWNMIEYYFPYKNLIEENWNDVLQEFIPRFVEASDELEYKLTVLAMIARVRDTHANIWGKDNVLREYKGLNYAPLEMTFVGDDAVVKDYYDDTLGEQSGLKAGDIIESINHIPMEDILRKKLPYTPASNYPTQLRDIARDLLRTNDTILDLSGRRDEQTFSVKVKCYDNLQMNPYKKYMEKDTCFKILDGDIAYLYPGSVKNEYLPEIMKEAMSKEGLIIDFRCYPSDFIVFSLSEYLQPMETNFVRFSNGSITSPGQFTLMDVLSVGKKNSDYYKGKVVIIVNETTQSSAEYHTMAFRTAPGAMVIGSTTAGADGNVSSFKLPGGISTMISGIGVYYPDGTETQRVGIVPDIEVTPTVKGIREGRDEVLERAIAIINEQ